MELEAAAGALLQLLMHVGVRPSREPLLGVSECVSLGIAPLFGWELAWVPISGVARAAAAAPPVADALPPPPGAPLLCTAAELTIPAGGASLAATIELPPSWRHGSVFVDGALAAHFGSAAPSLLLRGTGGERACLLPGRLREGANALVFLVLARDAGPPEQEEVAVVTLARAEMILAQ